MENLIEIKINLRPETLERIEEILKFSKIMNQFDSRDLPSTEEDVIKAALDEYLNKIDTLYQSVINHNLFSLKESSPLKNKIKEFIGNLEMTQKELSDLTGIQQGSLSHILSNRNQPSMDMFFRIWIVLGCPPIEHLFYRESQ